MSVTQTLRRLTITLAMAFACLTTFAAVYDFEVDGIYYDILDDNSVGVTTRSLWTHNSYSGIVRIPEAVYYNGKIYSVTRIRSMAFFMSGGLKSVTIPNSVTKIDGSAFGNCTGLTSVTIPNSVTTISDAFKGCSSLRSINIPESITVIHNSCFSGCSSLTSITIPNSVIKIGDGAFWGCTSLTTITIPESVTSIGRNAFEGCTGLRSVTIPNSVTVISDQLFYDCINLTSVNIPEFVTKIGDEAFAGCSSLIDITIPNSVTEIGSGIFWKCSSLAKVTISNFLSVINDRFFANCSSLAEVTIPESVTEIRYEVFRGCINLTNLICKAVNPPKCYNYNLADINMSECTLYVPEASISKYRDARPWSGFLNINSCDSKPVTAITLQHTSTIKVGDTQMIRATITPADATDATLNWSSSNESVATVDANGTVTAIAPGTVTITATAADGSGVTASCEITVSDNAAIGDVDAAEATVRVTGGEIVVEGAPVGAVVRIFAVDGMELYRSVSTGEAVVFAPGVRGVCFVAVGNRCVKISL